jgi:hypothetical protein
MTQEQKLCEHEWKHFETTYEGHYATPYDHYICKKCELEKTTRG